MFYLFSVLATTLGFNDSDTIGVMTMRTECRRSELVVSQANVENYADRRSCNPDHDDQGLSKDFNGTRRNLFDAAAFRDKALVRST